MSLDMTSARRMLLAAQGLLKPPAKPATRISVLKAIRAMGALQIDTISVVARSPYFVLWSRLGRYDPAWLDQLLARGDIFEHWAHAACFLPIEDFPLYRPSMDHDHPRYRAWLENHSDVADQVRAMIRERGQVKSSDFKRADGGKAGWWSWKPEKTALECLFVTGELMIARRENFQRVYAPSERVLGKREFPELSLEEARREKVVRVVKFLGLAKASWVPDYFRQKTAGTAKILADEAASGRLIQVEVAGWKEPAYVHSDNRKFLSSALRGRLRAEVTTFLMPFDPVVWHRRRARELFDFHYQIEVYTPGHKRQFGYLTLPILHRDALVGRMDAKAHRQEGKFEVRALHLEDGVTIEEDLVVAVAKALRSCAEWHQTPEVQLPASGKIADELRTFVV